MNHVANPGRASRGQGVVRAYANVPGLILIAAAMTIAGCTDVLDADTQLSEDDIAFAAEFGDANLAKGIRGASADVAMLKKMLVQQSPDRSLSYYRLPNSRKLADIPQDPKNPLTPGKVKLGALLYHETALGVNAVQSDGVEGYSCASCHHAQAGFQANIPQGLAEGGIGFGFAGEGRVANPYYDSSSPDRTPDIQPIRTPTAMNGAYQELMLWNGQFGGIGDNIGTEAGWTGPKESNFLGLEGLETQAHAGLAVHRMSDIEVSRVYSNAKYQSMFAKAFPGEVEPINRLNAALAIGAFERTILANEAPWQKFLQGNKNAMTDQQVRGAMLFFGKAECSACHTGPALNSMTFHALGMNDIDGSVDPSRVDLRPFGGALTIDDRRGRGAFSNRPEDEFAWKTPQLYNLLSSPFYGHGASFSSVRDVIEYKNAGVVENADVDLGAISPMFKPLGLSPDEVTDLTAFLEEALYDSDLMRYVPTSLPSGNCTPVNDPQAQIDLGCTDTSVAAN